MPEQGHLACEASLSFMIYFMWNIVAHRNKTMFERIDQKYLITCIIRRIQSVWFLVDWILFAEHCFLWNSFNVFKMPRQMYLRMWNNSEYAKQIHCFWCICSSRSVLFRRFHLQFELQILSYYRTYVQMYLNNLAELQNSTLMSALWVFDNRGEYGCLCYYNHGLSSSMFVIVSLLHCFGKCLVHFHFSIHCALVFKSPHGPRITLVVTIMIIFIIWQI